MKPPSVGSKQKLNVPPSAVNVQHELAECSVQSLFVVQSRTVSVVLHMPVTVVVHAALLVHAVVVDEAAQLGKEVPGPRSVVPQQTGVLLLVQSEAVPHANGLESGADAESATAESCIVPPESTGPLSLPDVAESLAASVVVDASLPDVSSPAMPELLLLLQPAAEREPTSTTATTSRLRMAHDLHLGALGLKVDRYAFQGARLHLFVGGEPSTRQQVSHAIHSRASRATVASRRRRSNSATLHARDRGTRDAACGPVVARPVAIALLTCGTLCCSFDFGSWGSGYESPPTEGCTTQSAGCPSLGPIPAHAYAAEAGSGGFFDQSCPSNYTCVGGWASCGDDCDTSVVGDPNNCGACGNTCASGTCTEGSCLAVDVLAGGFGSPSGVALDADSVYFGGVTATASGILTVPKAGGAIANDAIHTAPPTSIAVDGTGTYFAIPTDEDLVDSPILVTRQAGDPIVRLGGYAGVGSTVMLGGGSVFWSGEIRAANGGSVVGIFSVPEVGGAPTLVTPIEFDYFAMPTPMLVKGAAMQGGDLFYVDGRNVMVLRAGAATPTLLYTDPSSLVIDITTDEASVYWYGFFAPSICAPCSGDAGATASEVRRMPLGGGAVDMLFAPDDGTEIFAAAGDVFTIVGDTLSRFDTATSSSTTLTRGSGAVSGFASDATFIYWTVAGDGTADPTTGGKLLRLAL